MHLNKDRLMRNYKCDLNAFHILDFHQKGQMETGELRLCSVIMFGPVVLLYTACSVFWHVKTH